MFLKKILVWIFKTIVALVIFSVVLTAIYTVVNPPLTPLMLIRVFEGLADAKAVGISKDWESYDNISPHVFRAVIAAEDGKFLKHEGFDWKAIENAQKRNERAKGKKLYGASTITMQTAKNAFLWPGRSYLRKGLEAYFTVLIEALWGKKRILEVYVNIIEWGDGIYGVEAASQEYFKKPAKNLTAQEAALLASVLPNPRRWTPAKPTKYILKRRSFIQTRMRGIALPKE
ncbi:MAG TPA: monofunctional biosynthetic peptidoglycan transglycosylase [Patescibacteria group bacterium]|nr:monofunctional biosynthetic peptidoglycan transglycosylase [Patescibacteria group bacterium]